MKVLITGANGFIGKSLTVGLRSEKIETVALGRKEMDLLSDISVSDALNFHRPDVVVHCAVMGNGRPGNDTQEMFDQNIRMYNNLKSQMSKFGCMINIGTGAEFDRRRDLRLVRESQVLSSSPIDFYGHSKNLIARDIYFTDRFFNLRIFGCFGPLEGEDRLLKIAFNKNLISGDLQIADDKEMDFVHVDDLASAVTFFSENFESSSLPKDVNVVYSQKMRLSEIIKHFIPAEETRIRVNVGPSSSHNYTGDSTAINSLGISCFSRDSLKNSLEKYYNVLREIQRGKIEQT